MGWGVCLSVCVCVGAYPEIDHPVVQPGVLVDGGSALLRENKNTSHQPCASSKKYSTVGQNLQPKMENKKRKKEEENIK